MAESTLTTVFGWWDWDAETPALVNRVTGERVAFRGKFGDPDLVPSDETWLRFDYEHPELSFPLLVEERQAEERLEKGLPAWRLDYQRSSHLWRREFEGETRRPIYGAWRRVDDCVTDALSCWPESEYDRNGRASYVCFDGGWLNGDWDEAVSRRETRLATPAKEQPNGDDYNPWLFPMDAVPPSRFDFYDLVLRRNGPENWSIDNPVLLDGLRFEDPELRYGPSLPANTPLKGLDGRTAYLLSEDSTRVLYPYFGDTKRRSDSGHWKPHFSLIYVDNELLLTGLAKPIAPSRRPVDWTFRFYNEGFYFRSDSVDAAFHINSRHPLPSIPSRALWLRSRWAILDGFSCWEGSKARSPDWLPELELVAASGIQVALGYRGGQWAAPLMTARF
ncbi:hypothetical protein [Pelagibius sp.]|uniref:hypothetical protein n=1 Tax=Pelagibius sp. TaxID=1931238 RepID=UPI003BAEB7D6